MCVNHDSVPDRVAEMQKYNGDDQGLGTTRPNSERKVFTVGDTRRDILKTSKSISFT